jgi:hypothetical protein
MATFLTTLPPLENLGLGTGSVEALDHYVSRLAGVFCVRQQAICVAINRHAGFQNKPHLRRQIWNGPGGSFERRMLALEDLTGVSTLRHSSFWAVSDALAWVAEDGRPRWCPRCINDRQPWQLVWTIALATRCQIHNVDLEEFCVVCGSPQPCVRPFHVRSVCASCGSSLGHEGIGGARALFHDWADKVLHDLVAWCATPDVAHRIPASNFRTFLSLIQERDPSLPKFIRQYVRKLSANAQRCRPSVAALLNLAALQAVDPLDILLRPKEAASAPLLDLGRQFSCLPFGSARRGGRNSWALACIKDGRLRHQHGLPPLSLLLRFLGVNAEAFRVLYPEEVAQFTSLRQSLGAPYLRKSFAQAFAAQMASHRHGPRGVLSSEPRKAIHLLARVEPAVVEAAKRVAEIVHEYAPVQFDPRPAPPIPDDVIHALMHPG